MRSAAPRRLAPLRSLSPVLGGPEAVDGRSGPGSCGYSSVRQLRDGSGLRSVEHQPESYLPTIRNGCEPHGLPVSRRNVFVEAAHLWMLRWQLELSRYG